MLRKFRETIANLIAPELKERRNLLERQSNVDPLTDLGNRRAFELAQPAAEKDPNLSFIVFDLNSFKKVNDNLGHTAGDKVLIEFARRLKLHAAAYTPKARAMRPGGDEFVAIIETKFAESFRDRIEAERIMAGQFIVTASGTIGDTFDEADGQLNARKITHKAAIGVLAPAVSAAAAANFNLAIA